MNTTPLVLARARDEAQPGDRDIARLLAKRYGDGTVYLPSGGRWDSIAPAWRSGS